MLEDGTKMGQEGKSDMENIIMQKLTNKVDITIEGLLSMEHDFIRAYLKEAKRKIDDGDYDELVVASDAMIQVRTINDFVSELIGDE